MIHGDGNTVILQIGIIGPGGKHKIKMVTGLAYHKIIG